VSYGGLLAERGDDAGARAQYEEVLRIAPGTVSAQDAQRRLQ